MTATITNTSPFRRTSWVVVTFPTALVSEYPVECRFLANGVHHRAVRGSTHGQKTVFRIRITLDGEESIDGDLEPESSFDTRIPDTFQAHPWVTDSLADLVPEFGVRVREPLGNPVDRWSGAIDHVTLIDSSPAHMRYKLARRIPDFGLHLHWWVDIHHRDPVATIFGKVVWSDRNDPTITKQFEVLGIRSGERIAFDFSKAHGISSPVRQPDGKWIQVLNSELVELKDGGGLPLSGSMLCFASLGTEDLWVGVADESVRNLRAAMHGPIVGVCHDWDYHFLACKNVPHVSPFTSPPAGMTWSDMRWDSFLRSIDTHQGWFSERPLGCKSNPSRAGDQEDFGATKGTHAVSYTDPRFIHQMRHSVQAELFRGVHHYETTGKPIDLRDHPNWITWSGETHYRDTVSPDRLGKDPYAISAITGVEWDGYDDQHRSQNNLAAYMCLTDDPLMDDHVALQTTTDEAAYRLKVPRYGPGAPRAQGRVVGALAQLQSVVPKGTALRIKKVILRWLELIEAQESLTVEGPMKVLKWHEPDERKGIYDDEGNPDRFVSMWQHGLAIVGLYHDWKLNGHEATKRVLEIICETMGRFGCFEEGSAWRTVEDIAWLGGESPKMGSESSQVVSQIDTDGVRLWTKIGIAVSREFLGESHLLASKLDTYLDVAGFDWSSVRSIEWIAATRNTP